MKEQTKTEHMPKRTKKTQVGKREREQKVSSGKDDGTRHYTVFLKQ